MESMLTKCNATQRAMSICIEDMRECISSARRVHRYCLSWPKTIVKHKAKINAVEDELSSLGKSFDFLSDKDGEKRKKINSLQAELLFLQRKREDFVSVFWKVNEIVEAKLEHFSTLLDSAVEYEQNQFVLDNFSHVVDLLVECKSLSVNIKLVVHSWEVLPKLREKY